MFLCFLALGHGQTDGVSSVTFEVLIGRIGSADMAHTEQGETGPDFTSGV